MSRLKMRDGTRIYFKDWGHGPPMVFSHGWPLTADAWDPQLIYFGERGHRVIAHDRRGHGRSDQTWFGNDMNTWADDLATLLETLDLREVILVGHSTGGGEVARYVGRHGTSRLSRVVLVGAVPPLMLQTSANPLGLPMSAFDAIREGTLHDRSTYFRELALPFYGFNRPGAKVSQGLVDAFWLQGMQGGLKSLLDCIEQFSETDFTEDLWRIDVPTLVVHGDDDQIVPIVASAKETSKLVKHAQLMVYRGGAHGLATTRAAEFNADLLRFIDQTRPRPAPSTEQPLVH